MRSLLLLTVLSGCGPRRTSGPIRDPDFECRDRRMEYVATGTIMYAEQGVRLYCDGNVPTAEKYFIDKSGQETKESREISAGVFDDTWKEFQAAGWRQLDDCQNPSAGKLEAIQTFDVTDGDVTKSFRCPGTELPFPYDRLRNALDMAAAELGEK
jgi:hypothetical protein